MKENYIGFRGCKDCKLSTDASRQSKNAYRRATYNSRVYSLQYRFFRPFDLKGELIILESLEQVQELRFNNRFKSSADNMLSARTTATSEVFNGITCIRYK